MISFICITVEFIAILIAKVLPSNSLRKISIVSSLFSAVSLADIIGTSGICTTSA